METKNLERAYISLRRQRKQLANRINVHCFLSANAEDAEANEILHCLVRNFLKKCASYRCCKHLLTRHKIADALILGYKISGSISALIRAHVVKRETHFFKTR